MTDKQNDNQPGKETLGPIDLFAIEFPGNNFKGEILRNLYDLVAAGTIRVIDLVLITKNQENQVSAMNLKDAGPELSNALVLLQASVNQMLTLEDISAIGEALTPNSSAGIMLIENVWARKTKQAMLDANGRLLMHMRIPDESVQEALTDLSSMSGQTA